MIKIKLFEYWATQIDWGQGRVVLVSDQAEKTESNYSLVNLKGRCNEVK